MNGATNIASLFSQGCPAMERAAVRTFSCPGQGIITSLSGCRMDLHGTPMAKIASRHIHITRKVEMEQLAQVAPLDGEKQWLLGSWMLVTESNGTPTRDKDAPNKDCSFAQAKD